MELDSKYIFNGEFGLERETLRVNGNGGMAQTDHPFESSSMERDFCENQLEIITPVCNGAEALMRALTALDSEAKEMLRGRNEFLWMYSNPPRIASDNDIIIAKYSGDRASKHEYRKKLAEKYGKRLMLYSGIHLNLSFPEEWLEKNSHGGDYKDFKNRLYFRLFRQAVRHSWLLVLLTAASPVYDGSFDDYALSGSAFDGYASKRNGNKGYKNRFSPILDYTDIEAYVRSVESYIKDGSLLAASELYVPVRVKPRGENSLDALREKGINHIELRMFDLNPLSPVGIFTEDIEFAYYLMLYLISLDDFVFTPELQLEAERKHEAAARYYVDAPLLDEAIQILDAMTEYFKSFPRVINNIVLQKAKLTENNRYCVRVYEKYKDDYQKQMLSDMKQI